ncbi:hypothetical protein KEM48_007114 [Puccinia striiformis f. sp. tritici PST-130]|nr:hypothetical protein KEM48_007114 [Puccinia striiformis f. sp. tritici PST-130]
MFTETQREFAAVEWAAAGILAARAAPPTCWPDQYRHYKYRPSNPPSLPNQHRSRARLLKTVSSQSFPTPHGRTFISTKVVGSSAAPFASQFSVTPKCSPNILMYLAGLTDVCSILFCNPQSMTIITLNTFCYLELQ